jgi:hypothetical protein
MDPLSIATASAHIIGTCATLSKSIYKFISKTKTVDTAIRVLDVEISTLSQTLGSIASSFSSSAIAGMVLESQTGYEAQYWVNVKQSMDDCGKTLEELERVLKKVKVVGDGGGFLTRAKKQIRLDFDERTISLLKDQVAAYRQTMQLSLQVINV